MIKLIEDFFSAREIATGIWAAVLLSYAAGSERVRRAFVRAVQALFKTPILVTLLIVSGYVMAEIWALREIGIWDASLLKETGFWFLFSAIALFDSVAGAENKEIDFKKLLKETLGGLAFIEFTLSFYTFSLPSELVLVPSVSFLAIATHMTKGKSEYAPAAKVFRFLLGIVGVCLIIHAVHAATIDPSIFSTVALRQFLLPPALTFLFIPVLYAFSLYSIYSMIFFRISFALKDKQHWRRRAKWRAVKTGNINLRRTRRLSKVVARKVWSATSLQDVDFIFDEFDRPISIQPNDLVELKTTGETAKVGSVIDDFVIMKFQDGDEEIWVGDLRVLPRN